MKQFILKSVLCCILSLMGLNVMAQQRRPIDNEHPLWLIHVDVWNQADPQKIINLIPDEIKPYVCMNLSLSCSYDKDLDMYQRPQNAIRTYKSWATVCQANGMWFTCQPASGGHTHIQDDDLEIFEYFYKQYPNFLGWNYAEQFWGFNEAGDKSSSSDVTRIALFAKLVRMAHQYGGFLTISFCGNIWSHPLNPVGMMKRNADLLQACREYPEAILWLYKYTIASCFYNNESVTFSPFISGLAANYGVRYDNCGYNDGLTNVLGENHHATYPTSAGIGTVMEQTCVNGGAVWDGPELIWTEDFQNLNNSQTSDGYTRRNWGTYAGFRNAWLNMFSKIIDGTMYIPTRQEVVEKTKIAIINDITSGNDEAKYAAWGDLYDGLYKQTDPFNRGNGQGNDNFCYFKKTGRYGAIPVCVELYDDLAKSIPVKIKKSQKWSSESTKTSQFKDKYPIESYGDLYVNRFRNQLVTYTPYTYLNSKKSATGRIPLKYNTCDTLILNWGKLSSAIVHENAESIDFYLNNYRSDSTARQNDIITIVGATEEPTFTYKKGTTEASFVTPTKTWDASKGTFTLTLSHNGPIEVKINCHGNNTENRLTDVVSQSKLSLPKQPELYYGPVIIEAEDMDFKNVSNSVNNAYFTAYRNHRGHAGNGFVDMGTSKEGILKCFASVNATGTYRVGIRYSNKSSNSGRIAITKSGSRAKYITMEPCGDSEWKKGFVEINLTDGQNTFTIANTDGTRCYIDQAIITPADMEEEEFDINIRNSAYGTVTANVEKAAEGTVVELNVVPAEGYSFKGWNVIHGGITVNEDNTFTMPDDIVTLEPLFEDNNTIYQLSLTTTANTNMPIGWRCDQGEIHEYPGSYSSGARIMTGFNGYQGKALYWRDGYAAYGYQNNYKLYLEPGDYKLYTVMAAWKGTPKYAAQILKSNGSVHKEATSVTATPNVNGDTSGNISTATEKTLSFSITQAGYYIIRYKNTGSTSSMQEFLLAGCSLRKVPDPSAIEQLDADNEEIIIYDLMGRQTSNRKGIVIENGKLIMVK